MLSDDPHVADAATSPSGATGLIHTAQATGLRPGTLGLALGLEYTSGQDVVRVGNDARRFLGHLALSYTPIEYFEAFATLSARAVTNSLGDPQLIQSVGDLSIGGKGVYPISDALAVGALLRVRFPAGANQVGLDLSSTSVDFLALTTADLRSVADVPLRFHLNFGVLIDNQANLFPFVLDRIERYGQGVYDYDRFDVGIAFDAPLEYVTPFLEWTTEYPLNHHCNGQIAQGCVVELGFPSYPSWLTIGARSQPVAGLSFNAAVDLGITTKESQGTPAVPGWNLMGGIAYNLDPSGTRVVEVPVEVPIEVPSAAATSHVEGTVVEAGTGAPIADVRVRYVGTTYTDQITGPDGRFRTFDFAPGTPVTIEISHPDYVAMTMNVAITPEVASGTLELQPAFTGARVAGRVTAPAGAEATITFRGPSDQTVVCDADGSYEVELEPGEYRVTVAAPGARTVRETVALEGGRFQRGWSLEPASPSDLVRWTGSGVELGNDTRRLAFDASGDLSADSLPLLDALAEELRGADTRLLVRAHTDPKDTVEEELELTATRAGLVIDYLVSRGVSRSQLEADGVGSAEPLIPNVTDRNRRMNNRIEFQLLD